MPGRRGGGKLAVVAVDVVPAPNDKQQLEPMLGKIGALPEELGEGKTLLADTGYFSTANVEACEQAGIEPLIARGRRPHHPPLQERFAMALPAPENAMPVAAMAHRLNTPEGRTLGRSMPCASMPRNQCPASSNPLRPRAEPGPS